MKKEIAWAKIPQLFLIFFKIGAFTFGGGYAMLPMIERETVDKKHWIASSDILDIAAIAESTPGPIAVNTATFVGFRVAGTLGALAATLGVVLPSFAIILAISSVLSQFEHIKAIQYAFNGIRAGVLALILHALISMLRQAPKHLVSYLIAAFAFISVAFFNFNVLLVLAICALTGLVNTQRIYGRGRKK